MSTIVVSNIYFIFWQNVQSLFARGHFVPEFEEGPLHELHLVDVKVPKKTTTKNRKERIKNNDVFSRARF